ncbi:PTS system trehalose-specific EIIBC component [Virgibacillus pantothenticus]|uniref:PTS system trehalose-specific EIIBC component n=1 Tax=Virgibacillus pantothenticus TaxID=1473 RepID=UPI001C22F995|nr:PTS system trehalose-specific EIIBC component [Virgibacillus pantothenticus]MBU8565289.1 PTS system trehalose-specific EIIBC component [Virgibacillus pantothenticus]MBU8599492.1 PTS system trehalose-specific EIIBC component [Virgibacillus pantothenticus]MBU8633608.1 PTS system trehalose-specific EIIBC component [Virgibacillus pantothenticus]MBU8641772.1 PTS system trehalose-specific EIIBC component [Virgibacillus pantothenticus]MBU8645487.1 PTS system trehalose-specific EIIBC component [Vir
MGNGKQAIYAPLSGNVISLEKVADPTFSQKMMGEGLAIEPSTGKVVAPFSGKVVQLFPTKHAIGLESDTGIELLIHIGLETVSLDGEGFDAFVKQGDRVQKGDTLLIFDMDLIKKKGFNLVTPIIITNSAEWSLSNLTTNTSIQAGDELFTLTQQTQQTKQAESTIQFAEEAKDIVKAIGGANNIQAATHCVTRLRFALKDEDKVDTQALEDLNIVKGSFTANGQFQVVIGQGTVDKVYQAMIEKTGIREASKEEVKAVSGQKQNALQRGVKVLADIFIPILPAIVTAGLLMGINNILANPGIFGRQAVIEMYPQWAGIADMINIIANTALTFLPALIGWSAMKRFGGSELLGIVLGLILVHPALLNAWEYGAALKEGTVPTWNLFGLEVNKIGYQGQVLPVLFASWLLAKIELFLRKRIWDSIQLLVVAPVALLVTGFLTFIIIGPITFTIGNWITDGLVALFDQYAVIGGFVYGALYAPMVITGMHHTFLAVDLQLIGSTGSTFLWPILALSNIAQGAAAFAIMLAAKDDKLKGLAGTSGISAWLGITEPAMFGVNLRFKYPFIAAIIGSSIAGAFITMQKVLATTVGVGGVPGIFSIIPGNWTSFFIGMAIVIVVPFIITYAIALRKRKSLE